MSILIVAENERFSFYCALPGVNSEVTLHTGEATRRAGRKRLNYILMFSKVATTYES